MKRAERYLSQYIANKEKIERRLEDIATRRAALGLLGISYDTVRVQTSPRDKMCDAVTALIAATDDIAREIVRVQRMQDEIESVIDELEPAKRNIAYSRFRDGYELRVIAASMNYTERHTRRLYVQMLKDVEAILDALQKRKAEVKNADC